MKSETACDAIRARKRLEVRYDGYARVVEVHAVGYSKKGNLIMRVWQVRGGSVSGEKVGWKVLKLDEAIGGHLIDEEADAPRQGYSKGDSAMERILCQI